MLRFLKSLKTNPMKRLFPSLIMILMTNYLFCQSPEKISYQAVVRNGSNQLVTNQAVGIKISILQGTSTGTIVYQETFNPNPQTNENGLVTLEIGAGIPISGTFADIDWSTGYYYLKTETDPSGGTDYSITGVSQILSVPYALFAKTAETTDYNNLTNQPSFATVATSGAFEDLLSKPTTLADYGITDAMSKAHPANVISSANISNWTAAYTWGNHAGLYRPITYLPVWGDISAKPTTVNGFGITDAVSTSGNQSIAGSKTFTGTIIGKVNANNTVISNVATPVADHDAATKAYVDALKEIIYSELLNAGLNGIVKDPDGKVYKTIKIGEQIWMAENLAYLPEVSPSIVESNTVPHYYVYGYQGTNVTEAKALPNFKTYGVLYNWAAAMDGADSTSANPSGVQGVCPSGWHLPSRAEWLKLINFLGGIDIAGGKMKESGFTHWVSPNTAATNESGFTGLPAGLRSFDGGVFTSLGSLGGFWSTTLVSYWGIDYGLSTNFGKVGCCGSYKTTGYSVRCVKD
jgi:uncharacterized protein (TIGR02145 family)